MKCPHCLMYFHSETDYYRVLGEDRDGWWSFDATVCASCQRYIISLGLKRNTGSRQFRVKMSTARELTDQRAEFTDQPEEGWVVYPKGSNRPPVPDDVLETFREDYQEACLILADSPKASAALSRRCLQHILQEKAGVKEYTLYDQIQEVIDTATLPSDLVDSFHTLRELGNVGAHPTKNANTGEIVPVEPVEAEWCLDVIELLYDFYFVRPADVKRRQQALSNKRHGANDSSNT